MFVVYDQFDHSNAAGYYLTTKTTESITETNSIAIESVTSTQSSVPITELIALTTTAALLPVTTVVVADTKSASPPFSQSSTPKHQVSFVQEEPTDSSENANTLLTTTTTTKKPPVLVTVIMNNKINSTKVAEVVTSLLPVILGSIFGGLAVMVLIASVIIYILIKRGYIKVYNQPRTRIKDVERKRTLDSSSINSRINHSEK